MSSRETAAANAAVLSFFFTLLGAMPANPSGRTRATATTNPHSSSQANRARSIGVVRGVPVCGACDWIARTTQRLAGFDALICPTVPIVAPAISALVADDEAFFRTNGQLLRNTFLINFLDACAFSLPCQHLGELPVGLMLAAPAGHDAGLAGAALAVEAALA